MTESNEYRDIRLKKLEELKRRGCDPFLQERFERTHSLHEAFEAFPEWENSHQEGDEPLRVKLAGRIMAKREMGKAMFLQLQDQSGRLQIYVRKDDLGDDGFEQAKHFWDLGDFLGVSGFMFRTRTGEISLHVQTAILLSIALLPLPAGKMDAEGVVHQGLSDVELRYRLRYADLNVNPTSRDVLVNRSRLISAVRRFLDSRKYIEVETPVLQAIAGGAAARPFKTHHNALEMDLKLRISLELPLKRLIVGGLEKVYEIGRVFRNEGISTRHNPEFTLLELYEAYADLDGIMELVEDLFRTAAIEVLSTTVIQRDGKEIDLAKPWHRLSLLDGIKQYAGIEPNEFDTLASAKAAGTRVGLPMDEEHTVGGIIEKVLERFVQPNLIEPTFITDFPTETSPLAKKRPDNPALTRRFEAYVFSQEVGNAFSELNDPIDQRERFAAQVQMRTAGDEEAHPMDEDFIRALEYGMPPTGGLGIGMDRLAMIFLGAESIRDVLFFPLLKPE